MTLRMNSLAGVALVVIMAACASKPPQYERIAPTSNPTTEIDRTDQMLREALDRQVDVLSPKNFADAEKALNKAKEQKARGKSNEDILQQVSYARGWLNEANSKAEIAQTSMKDITDARGGAVRAGAPHLFPREWDKADKQLQSITSSLEKGRLGPVEKKGNDLVTYYRDLETASVKKSYLSAAEENIKAAKKEHADKKAPRTYELAVMKYENAIKLINSDPRNNVAIRSAADDANRESVHLLEVAQKVNAGNTEDLVLTAERQQRQISSLRNEYSSTSQELEQSQKQLTEADKQRMQLEQARAELEKTRALNETAEKIRGQFKPNEAEVFTESGKLMVRLKGLQFPTNQATLGPKNQALLKKVQTALSDVKPSKITVEGHTDSTGSPDRNTILSEERAQAVEHYLVTNGAIDEEKVEAVGMGSDDPISDNTTAQGRAQNRRIDLVIETE